MTPKTPNSTYGFLSIVHETDLGHCGGLLIVNSLGRPLEFHCTSPVIEKRAQKILYGATYYTFLYCEQIALGLLAKAKRKPSCLLCDNPQLFPLGDMSDAPLGLVLSAEQDFEQAQAVNHFAVHDLTVWNGQEKDDFEVLRQLCIELTESIPLDEPFERITSAIEEAQAVVR